MSSYDAYQKFPEQMKRLQEIERELAGGTTAVVALVIHNKLFVANCGKAELRTAPGQVS